MRLARLFPLLAAFALWASAAAREPVHARKAMVVAAEPHAARAGLDVLRESGNAVDAAVAVGLTLAVTHPTAGNLGGGGFMLIRFPDGRATFIDFRETAPAAATRNMYLDEAGAATDHSVVGYQAVGTPGTARGLEMARGKYGSMPWKRLIEPARRLARGGFALPYGLAREMRGNSRLARFPESVRIFHNGGEFFDYGQRLVQPELAATLDRMAKKGADELYLGETARRIAADMARNGGLITMADLAAYEPKERAPVTGSYRGYEIVSAPPSSSGGAGVIQMLNMLEGTDYFETGAGSARTIHFVAEAMRRFFADRAELFGDTDFATDVPLDRLISKVYARERARSIDPRRATPSREISAGPALGRESSQTTHYSVVDERGMAVAVTYTLNGGFGSGVTAAGTGILLNNEMDDFTACRARRTSSACCRASATPSNQQAAAVGDDADHRLQGWQAGAGGRLARRTDDHLDGAADDPQRDRPWHESATGGRLPAVPSPMDARRAAD